MKRFLKRCVFKFRLKISRLFDFRISKGNLFHCTSESVMIIDVFSVWRKIGKSFKKKVWQSLTQVKVCSRLRTNYWLKRETGASLRYIKKVWPVIIIIIIIMIYLYIGPPTLSWSAIYKKGISYKKYIKILHKSRWIRQIINEITKL